MSRLEEAVRMMLKMEEVGTRAQYFQARRLVRELLERKEADRG